ncbi:hypothetical protein D6D04_05449 [Aureobasidium pullulans]|nr:hypothetical protein D6D04_05449 [Aureobasidium pullulans]
MDMSVNHIYAVALSDSASADTPNWAITVQPKKQKRLFFHDHPQTSVFLSTNTDNSERRNSDGFKGEELLVKLLIAENDVAGIDNRVQEVLSKVDKNQPSDSWLRSAILALQQAHLCNKFSIDDRWRRKL